MTEFFKLIGKKIANISLFILKIIYRPRIKINKIIKYLKRMGCSCNIFYHKKNKTLIKGVNCMIKAKHALGFKVYVVPHETFLDFSIPDLLEISCENKSTIFQILLEHKNTFCSFHYDSEKKTILYRLGYPSLRSNISFHQFHQCLSELLQNADNLHKLISGELHKLISGELNVESLKEII